MRSGAELAIRPQLAGEPRHGAAQGVAEGAADEEGVDPARKTETFAEVVLAVDTWRWSGVPFRVRSGKALGAPRTEVAVTFHRPQRIPTGLTGCDQPDRLRIGIALGPDRLRLDLNISGPGDPFEIDPVTLEAPFGPGELPPYGEVLKGILEGDPALSVRGDTAVECWRLIEPVQAAWRLDKVPLEEYTAGSRGVDGLHVSSRVGCTWRISRVMSRRST